MNVWLVAASSIVAAAATSAAPTASSDVPPPLVAAHQHLISPDFAKLLNLPPQDGAAFLKMLDKAGIRRGVVLSMATPSATSARKSPRAIAID